ncbi:MAG: plastocyanin/azurin family copper-binding protein [Anaerolineae bacterium]|jgi:nitrite reductase (NO-forming)
MRSRFFLAVLLMLVMSALAACGATPTETPTEGPAGGGQVDVTMINTSFKPKEITIQAGTTVVWTNEDPLPHTVTSGTRDNPSGLFDSGTVGQGETFQFTFEEPGTYEYFCSIHPGMDGTVIVE